jgi:cytochrome c
MPLGDPYPRRPETGLSAASGLAALCAAIALAVVANLAAAQEDPGQVIFNNACRTCHTVNEGDNRLGPSLAGIIGRKAGSLPGYGYSEAMKKSAVVWDEANLDRFIESPDAVVAGNNMKPYTGMTAVDDRAAIVAYLKAQGGD